MPVPHSYFPCSDVQGKSLSYCHAAACIKACLHSHWKDVPCLQGFSVSDNRDIFQPAAYGCHDLLPEEAHPDSADYRLCTHYIFQGL